MFHSSEKKKNVVLTWVTQNNARNEMWVQNNYKIELCLKYSELERAKWSDWDSNLSLIADYRN